EGTGDVDRAQVGDGNRLAVVLAEDGLEVRPGLDGATADLGHEVEGAEPGAVRRRLGAGDADDGRRPVRADADLADAIDDVERLRLDALLGDDRDLDLLVVAEDLELELLVRVGADDLLELGEGGDALAVDLEDPVAGLELALGGVARE